MSEQKTFDYMVKLLLIGSPCVGKTSILRRFADDAYSDSYVPTVGVDFKVRNVDLGGKIVKLQLWDAGGVKKFRSITESHYRGIHGVIFVYDVTNQNSFLSLQDWLSECNRF